MSTATWLKSEPTVLLWGDRWWLPQHKLPVPFGDLGRAAEVLASVWPFPVRTLRLVYQPDRLLTVAVGCPNGNRSTLAMALGDEFPALQHPAHVWGYEPILHAQERFSTLLHFEAEPGLFGLVQQLHRQGLTVRTAWPMATWLNALPPEVTDSGALTVVALHADRYCIYRHSMAGGRVVHSGVGPDVAVNAAGHLKDLAAQAESEFVLYVTSDDALMAQVEERVGLAPNQIVGVHSLWDALTKPATMPERHPAQLLPPVPVITPPWLVRMASVALLISAVGLGGWQVRQHLVAREAMTERQQAVETLREEVAHLQANATEMAALRSAISERPGGSRTVDLLRALGSAARPGVALRAVSVTGESFLIRGGVALGSAVWEGWVSQLGRAEAPWSLQTARPDADGSFQLRGTFRP